MNALIAIPLIILWVCAVSVVSMLIGACLVWLKLERLP